MKQKKGKRKLHFWSVFWALFLSFEQLHPPSMSKSRKIWQVNFQKKNYED